MKEFLPDIFAYLIAFSISFSGYFYINYLFEKRKDKKNKEFIETIERIYKSEQNHRLEYIYTLALSMDENQRAPYYKYLTEQGYCFPHQSSEQKH